jgi:hypothetical protein
LVVVAALFVVCGGDGGGGNSWQRIFDGRDVKLLTLCRYVFITAASSAIGQFLRHCKAATRLKRLILKLRE